MKQGLANVSFLQKGEGKDLLFLHGYLSNKESFSAQIAYFSKFYRVTAVDFLGFGQSAPIPTAFSVDDYADWLNEILHALAVERPHVIAHSFGCRVAVKLASKRCGVFDKMVLTGPAGVITNRGISYHCKVGVYRLVKRIAPRFAQRRFGSREYRSLSPLMRESYKKIVNEDLRKCAGQVCNEVLILQGTKDTVTTEKEARAYLRAFPNARLRYIDGGHFAFAEHPTEFCLRVEEFFYE
jgi:pimeloyl-ACP methyl ester carboxylesterase